MIFHDYESKPITRKAYQIKDTDDIICTGLDTYRLASSTLKFVAYEEVKPGAFIVYLNKDDVYHCNEELFRERNIV